MRKQSIAVVQVGIIMMDQAAQLLDSYLAHGYVLFSVVATEGAIIWTLVKDET